jgi:hypothetical protein
MDQLIADECILCPDKDDGRPREKKFRKDMKADFIAFRTIIDNFTLPVEPRKYEHSSERRYLAFLSHAH